MKTFALLGLLSASTFHAAAQAPGVPIEAPGQSNGEAGVIDRAGKLREAGKLVAADKFKALLEKPVPEAVTLPAARTATLSRSEIYELARRSRVRVGWYYLCHKCNHWHTRLAGGYPLTEDGVIATCHHVAKPEDDMREGYLIVVDAEGTVTPVTSVIASSPGLDITVLRATGGMFQAMPLNDQIRPGDAAYCLSDPLGLNGYFSDGMVNRFYRKPDTKNEAEALRLHVSTDWAPGSSGSPVLDQCGNVIGHVSTISTMGESRGQGEKNAPPRRGNTQIIVHEASPARGVLQLVQSAAGEAQKAPAPEEPAPASAPAPPPAESQP